MALARLRNPTEAQELTQEVFVHGMTKLPQLRDAAVLRRLAAADHGAHGDQPPDAARPAAAGRSRRCWSSAEAAGVEPAGRDGPRRAGGELYDGLEQLKPVDRATLVAFYIRGRSLKQMSREFETPVGTIKRRLHVARNRLRRAAEARREAGAGDGVMSREGAVVRESGSPPSSLWR